MRLSFVLYISGFNTSTSSNASTVIEQPIVNDYKIAESKISTVMPQASKAEGLAFKPPLMIEQVLTLAQSPSRHWIFFL